MRRYKPPTYHKWSKSPPTTCAHTHSRLQYVVYELFPVSELTLSFQNYFARLSILVGILRIAPNPKIRNILKGAAGFFVAIMCILLAQKLWVCEGNSEMAKTWKKARDPSCHLGLQVALTELVSMYHPLLLFDGEKSPPERL
jgi:hypothetical protein